MELKSFHLEKIRIKNFLSFYGNQEVKLSPFTAVTSCYSQGKEDMLAAIKFVFGGSLKTIYKENPNKLFHKIFWKQLETGSRIECCVEITLKFIKEEKIMKLYKGVKKSYFIYKIDGKVVSGLYYENLLNSLNMNAEKKNVILYKSFFDSVIWGAPEDFEMFLTQLLRMNSRLGEWRKTKEEIQHLKKLKHISLFEEKIEKINKTHGIIEKFIGNFNSFLMRRDYFRKYSNHVSFTQIQEENEEIDTYDAQSLENELDSSLQFFNALEMNGNRLLSELYVYELKFSLENGNLIQERIVKLKSKLKKLEIVVSHLWVEMKEMENKLKTIDNEISINLGTIYDLQQSYYLENRLTEYGRFIDYLEPFEFVDVLKEIIGDSILYGNLCDDIETAKSFCEHLRLIKYERREEFIIFNNYSSRFKDLLLGSGEKGIKMNNIQEFQIFLFKLKQYGLIEAVPIISKREFSFKLEEETKFRDIIYLETGIFLRSDGIISYAREITNHFDSTLIVKNTKQSLIQQETMYEEYRDLFFQRQIIFQSMNVIENDINYFKSQCKKRSNDRPKESKIRHNLSEIYNEYMNYFMEHERYLENAERERKQCEKSSYRSHESEIPGDLDGGKQLKIDKVSTALCKIENEKEKIRAELMNLRKKLRFATAFSHKIWFPPVKKYVLLEHPKKTCNFYYDIKFRKLESIMSKQDVEEFEGWKNWRKSTIDSLLKHNTNFTKLFKSTRMKFDNLTRERNKILSPLLEHCNLNLSAAANLIVDASLPFLNLIMNQSEGLVEFVSSLTGNKVEIIEIIHFNTFLKFIAALILFLEIANYEQVPMLFVDNVQEFLPHYKDTFEAVMDKSILNKLVSSHENKNFQMVARIAQYLGFFMKKNRTNSNNKKKNKAGPIQIIYFTSEDLVHAADCQLWIRNMIVADEFLTDVCDTYSLMEQIKFE